MKTSHLTENMPQVIFRNKNRTTTPSVNNSRRNVKDSLSITNPDLNNILTGSSQGFGNSVAITAQPMPQQPGLQKKLSQIFKKITFQQATSGTKVAKPSSEKSDPWSDEDFNKRLSILNPK